MISKKENRNGKVLVLGDDDRSFLTVVRSFGRQNINVHVGWCPSASFALHSKYIKKIHIIHSDINRKYVLQYIHEFILLLDILEKENLIKSIDNLIEKVCPKCTHFEGISG